MKKLVAVSGGVDSMVLANLYKNEDIVLVFVNYNFRFDTNVDEKIVTNFAQKNNLILEKLILTGSKPNKNFQNWAREKRYLFFKEIYEKYSCSELLVAHHKDDFLETCLMQFEKNPKKLFFGIKSEINLFNMKIKRPFLFKYFKNEIIEYAHSNEIQYNDDYTNFETKYKRNKIRNITLKNISIIEKQKLVDYFIEINKKNSKQLEMINKEYIKWKKSEYLVNSFFDLKFKEELIKEFINENYINVNLNKKIISNIILFIEKSQGNKKFLLSNNQYILKKHNKLYSFK